MKYQKSSKSISSISCESKSIAYYFGTVSEFLELRELRELRDLDDFFDYFILAYSLEGFLLNLLL